MKIENYDQAIAYLYNSLPVFHHIGGAAYKPGLENTIKLLDGLGSPQWRFKSIHIAGTNGKGSVSNMLAAIFQSAGYKTGLYTSPHLVDFGERIRVNGEKIDQNYVVDFIENKQQALESIQPSFFEATMAMAFQYFADSEVDIAIIEVGLGGRLDSTNIIQPLLSVITNISFDHTGFLGDTLEKIAAEKAGIIKQNTPVIIGEFTTETKAVFEAKANEMSAPIYYADQDLQSEGLENGFLKAVYHNKTILIGLTGEYQLKNLATVLRTIELYNRLNFEGKIDISQEAILYGLQNIIELTGLMGRWQVLSHSPKIIADTGHNQAGVQKVISQIMTEKFDKLHIVIGFANDKDIVPILALFPTEAIYYFTQANIDRALAAKELAKKALHFKLTGKSFSKVSDAIRAAKHNAVPDDLIFIGGSNFIVGEALDYFSSLALEK